MNHVEKKDHTYLIVARRPARHFLLSFTCSYVCDDAMIRVENRVASRPARHYCN